jgi:hypothetical protein
VAKGVISLIPQDKGPSAGGEIVDGAYEIGRERGPTPGVYHVHISAPKDTGKVERDPDTGETWNEQRESLPARYNTRTELTITVVQGGANEFDFPLKSAP